MLRKVHLIIASKGEEWKKESKHTNCVIRKENFNSLDDNASTTVYLGP